MKKLLALCLMLSLGFGTAFAGDGGDGAKKKAKTEKTAKKAKKEQGKKAGKAAKDEPKFEEGATTSKVRWDKMTWNFGEVPYGSDVSHTFTFKNVSGAPVAIANVGTSCGCTTPGYVKEPVQANQTGTVTAKYDSTRIGNFTKTLTVDLGGETVTLTITGTVKAPESEGGNK